MVKTAYTVELGADEIGSLKNHDELSETILDRILSYINNQVQEKLDDLTTVQDIFMQSTKAK